MKIAGFLLSVVCSAVVACTGLTLHANAAQELVGYYGDVTLDRSLSVADVVKLQKHLLTLEALGDPLAVQLADMNEDASINAFDLAILKRSVIHQNLNGIYIEVPDPTEPPTEPPTEAPTEPPTEPPTEAPTESPMITANAHHVYSSLPSQGDANLVIFYVDFPDARYKTNLTEEQVAEIAFGEEDTNDRNYPFDSISAFYKRSSKGAMDLKGKVFRYTAKNNHAAYEADKELLLKECYNAFRDSEDFTRFDGNKDGVIDATLISVPNAAGEDEWWPLAGGFFDFNYKIDGMSIGHMITGCAEIKSTTEYKDFVSSYLHELGHCMGIPDYYLYYSDDYEGFHGNAGTELMDADAYTDFGAFSKLMLGWYREDQVAVFDPAKGAQTFQLSNAQTNDGNCVIIPYGKLDERYFSEYFIIEYVTPDGNNSGLQRDFWWMDVGSGVRVFHVKAELCTDYWWTFYRYENGSEFTNYDDAGTRLIRLVNDGKGVYKTGAVINGNTPGFGWYDPNGNESVNPNVSISVGEFVNGQYSITISPQ